MKIYMLVRLLEQYMQGTAKGKITISIDVGGSPLVFHVDLGD